MSVKRFLVKGINKNVDFAARLSILVAPHNDGRSLKNEFIKLLTSKGRFLY